MNSREILDTLRDTGFAALRDEIERYISAGITEEKEFKELSSKKTKKGFGTREYTESERKQIVLAWVENTFINTVGNLAYAQNVLKRHLGARLIIDDGDNPTEFEGLGDSLKGSLLELEKLLRVESADAGQPSLKEKSWLK